MLLSAGGMCNCSELESVAVGKNNAEIILMSNVKSKAKLFAFGNFLLTSESEFLLQSPVSQTCKKMIGCWIFTSGPVSLTVSLNRQGYCSGKGK